MAGLRVTERRAWLLVALLSATAAASYLCRVNVSVAGALMMRQFGLSQPAMGRVFSAFLLGYALFQVPSGMLADRYGARRVLAIAALWWVAATLLLSATGWGSVAALPWLLAVRFLLGVGEAPTFPAAGYAVSRWIAVPAQGRANGFVISAIGAGSAIAPPLLTFVMVRWGWRAALLVSAAPALAVALGWLRAREPDALATKAAAPVDGGRALRSRSFVLLTLSYTLQGYVGYIFVFWFYLYLVDVRHFDLLRGAIWSSLPWLLSIISIPLGGIVSDRLVASFGERRGRMLVPVAGFAGAGLFLAFGAHTASATVAAASLAISTALVLSVEGPTWASMMRIAAGRTGAAGGVLNMGSNVGGLISPALTPVLAAHAGWENALFVAAAASVVAGVLWLGIDAGRKNPFQI